MEVSHDSHSELRIGKFAPARRISDDGNVVHELLVVKELEERFELARFSIDYGEREYAAVRMAVAGRPAPWSVRALKHVHHGSEC